MLIDEQKYDEMSDIVQQLEKARRKVVPKKTGGRIGRKPEVGSHNT